MLNRELLEKLARERLAGIPLPAEDWAALVPQIERVLAIVSELDGLQLGDAEPAPVYSVEPEAHPHG